MNRPCLIGIDPAFRESGFCVVVIDEERTGHARMFKSFLDFLKWLPEAPDNALVVIENSNEDNTLYAYHNAKDKKTAIAAALNVGKNQAASQYTVDACRYRWENTGQVFSVSPKKKGAKWPARVFMQAVKADGVKIDSSFGSQDARDAYKLAMMGRTLEAFKGLKR